MNRLEGARRRIAYIFDRFPRVVASVSGGKDSQVLWHLAAEEAARRGRDLEVFFLEQEAEYAGSIQVIETMMADPRSTPRWYQVPLRMTNATSHQDVWFRSWGEGETWMREKHPLAIHALHGAPDRFYDWFPWYEAQTTDTAFLVGIRSFESFNRWRAVNTNPGYEGIGWSTRAEGTNNFRFYPIFDWVFGEVWKYIADEGFPYNSVYDKLLTLRGANERTMRVSFLLHEQSYKAMATLQEIEPDTYDRLIRRIGGAHYAALYANEEVLGAGKLPPAFLTWRAFRDHLIATTPLAQMSRLVKRFQKQGNDEATCREHARQLLIHDWENNVPVRREKPGKMRERWWDRL